MSALTIAAADVFGDGSIYETLPAGEVIAAGQAVYKSSSTWLLAECDASTTVSTKSVVIGIALNSALVAGQPVKVQKRGTVTVSAVVTVGEIYVLDGGAGGICPEADIATNDWITIIGVGATTTTIKLGIDPKLIKAA